ncbi:MAG: phosphate ABC transporter permease PstA [Armatimonadetes bacterium]|nr:phosphate ABC transporter permease PstA [Armatimonadota bacterium]
MMYIVLSLMAAVVVLPVLGLLAYMMIKGLAGLNPDLFLKGSQALLPAMVGTLYLVLLTAAIAAPIGIAAAVYLSEYAHRGILVRLIRLAIINLAGVPSVVHGLFGLALFVMMLKFGRCLLSGAATMALLVLPLIISASEEALRQVPQRLRDGSLALGATRWQTIRRVVLPNALPGIMTGLILSISRAAGETAPILFTAAFLSLTNPYPESLFDEILALPYQLFVMTSEMPSVPAETKWATAFVLVVLVLGLNIGAILWRTHLRRAKRW